MSSQTLEQHLGDYYRSQKLPADAVSRLKDRIAEERPLSGSRVRRWSRRRWWTAIAATIVIAIAAGALILKTGLDPESRRTRTEIAQEAAREHNLRLEVEFPAAGYAELRATMASLNFSPVEPDAFKKGMGMRLLGARYASLQGQPAVQIKLADERGEICTLIEARPADRLASITRLTRHQVDGLLVDIWREKGLVMVLTRPIA